MQKILISACFLGKKVRYDGGDNLQKHLCLQQWIKDGRVVSICPEMAGGLPTPRPPSEIVPGTNTSAIHNIKVVSIEGQDVSYEYLSGANKALQLAKLHNIKVAILKAHSPSCGSLKIYDGIFSDKLVKGMGVTAALFVENGIQVFNENQIDLALDAVMDLAQ